MFPSRISPQEVFLQVIGLLASDLPAEQVSALLETGMSARYPSSLDPDPSMVQAWETCMTMNSAWGYVPTDDSWKSPQTLIQTLVDVRAGGGNFLLNVGPMGNGAFPPQAVERLAAIGRWVDVHGAAVGNVDWGPLQGRDDLRSTRRGSDVFVLLREWSEEPVDLADLPVQGAWLVATGQEVEVRRSEGVTWLQLPPRVAGGPGPAGGRSPSNTVGPVVRLATTG